MAAFTQIFDALRNISAGILRGRGDTMSSMWTGLIACWIIGLPCALFCAFFLGFGAIGIRLGMMLGISIGAVHLLFLVYQNRTAQVHFNYN